MSDEEVEQEEEQEQEQALGDEEVAADIKRAFREADQDGNGVLTFEEVSNVFSNLGEWSEEELQSLFEQADASGNGTLSYDEFVDWVMSMEEEGDEMRDVIEQAAEMAAEDEAAPNDEGENWEVAEDEDETYVDDLGGEAEDAYGDDSVYDEEEDMDALEDVEIDLEAKVTREEFKVMYVAFGYPKCDADEDFEALAAEAVEEGTSSGPDEGIPVENLLWEMDIEPSDAEMMLDFREAWDRAKAVVAGEAEMPEDAVEPTFEALEGAEVENPSAAASGLDRIAAFMNWFDLSSDDASTLIENNAANNELGLSSAEQAAVSGLSNVQERLDQIIEKPPALNSNVGYHSCNESCIKRIDQILAQCKESGEKFSDPEWDVMNNPTSVLYVDKEAPGYDCTVEPPADWKRLTELVEAPVLFKEDAKACDIIQGSIGTCFLLGAMGSMVSHCPKKFKKQFIKYDIEAGVYGVRFCVQGEWKYVIIDDYIPVNDEDAILYASSKDAQEVWVPLLEKAFCKLHTCYEMCDGGWGREAITSFYGGISGTLEVTDKHREDPSQYFTVLKNARKKGYLLCTGFKKPEEGSASGSGKCGEEMSSNGLVGGHAYSVLRVVEAEGNQLVCCRNPWGEGEWTGPWSDKNENGEWTDEMKAACGWTDEEDGKFWMSIEDFVSNCDGGAEYARTFGPKWKKVTKLSRFSKTSMKAKALEDYEAEADDEIGFVTGETLVVDSITECWWTGTKSDGSSGFFPGEKVKLLKRPIARFDLTLTPTSEDKDVKAVVMLMQPNSKFKRKFYKRKEDGLNYKDTSYPQMTLIAVGADGKKVWKKSDSERCIWGELKAAKGEVGKYQIYAMSATGSGEKFSIRAYTKNANPSLTDSPGATLADVKGVLTEE